MNYNLRNFAAALIVAIFFLVSIFSLSAKSDTKITKNFQPVYSQLSDSTDEDEEDGSGGTGIPPKE
ncbi:MAG: hypothetical protein J0M18_12295 [Ignavibacteria bacterium]|nr:hypothetical protein [Ignavibacteria bacterium]